MTIKDDVIRTNAEHPEWTAKQVAEHLGILKHHVYNNARAAGLKLAAAPPLPYMRPRLPAPAEPLEDAIAAPPPASEFVVHANDPAGMVAAQRGMIGWCDEKIATASAEAVEVDRHAQACADGGFQNHGWGVLARRARQAVEFYEKVKIALEAGYYIVPPFPVDIFAIRTKAAFPRGGWYGSQWSAEANQKAQLLPAGEGRYVDPHPMIEGEVFEETDSKGLPTKVRRWNPIAFRDVAFPFQLARAEIMAATQAALAMKVFDQVGSIPSRREARTKDPIICGQLLMPHRGRAPLTFFVCWWLDTKTL